MTAKSKAIASLQVVKFSRRNLIRFDIINRLLNQLVEYFNYYYAGCSVSFSSIPFFLLGGTREEWPANSGKKKTLTHT